MRTIYRIVLCALILSGCAQVPKESVELSATVGRDMVEMEKSHLAIINIYYDRLLGDINDFIDKVYMPYQIQQTLADPVIRDEMISAIEAAGRPDPTGESQQNVIAILGIFLEEVYREVEDYRQSKLRPVEMQRDTLIAAVEDAYDRIHYANSIVTGHLASVVKVHDTQNEILAKVNLEDLRAKVGIKATEVSGEITALTEKGKEKSEDIDGLIAKFDELMKKFSH